MANVKPLYISLVKSVLMYASTIWRPNLKVNIERVQHKALRHLTYLSGNPMSRFDHDYAAVGETFGLPTILSSMVASDNVLTFKIMSNGVQCSELKSLFPVNNPTYSLRHNQPFYHNVAITRHAENNPIYRLCVCYNPLSLRICIMDLAFHPNSVSKAIKEVTLSYG